MSQLPQFATNARPAGKKGQRIYGKMPLSPHFRTQIPSLDFLDAIGLKTNVKSLREGDWICLFCKNLNFSFRNECNRCQALAEPSRDPIEMLNARADCSGFMDHRYYFGSAVRTTQISSLQSSNELRNELFEKVCGRDDGFSNVVFISFELKDNSEDSCEDGEDLRQTDTTRILSLLDE